MLLFQAQGFFSGKARAVEDHRVCVVIKSFQLKLDVNTG